MPRFKRNFYVFTVISTVLALIVLDTLVLMSYEYIPVKDESFEAFKIIAAVAVYSGFFPVLLIVLAKVCVKYLKAREYDVESSGELRLFRDYVLAEAVVLIINTVYLFERSKPFFKSAYDEQRIRINTLNDNKETISSKLALLKDSYESCLSYTRAAAIICCVAAVFMMLSGARVLVKAYREQKSIFPK